MAQTQVKAPSVGRTAGRFFLRFLVVVAVAYVIGTTLNRVAGRMDNSADVAPAGFGRGVAQGALMPLALPNLLVGRDVTIYGPKNTGRTYKLGYTVGVNGCGLVFFGLFFWRLSRLRRRLAAVGTATP